MITALNFRNAHENGTALAQMFELRYRIFIEQVKYDVTSFDEMEYDLYDTPATVYLVSSDPQRGVNGMVRVAPTDRPYMIADVWPGLIDGPMPKSPAIFEGSRFAIDPTLDAKEKQRIKSELVCAFIEFGMMAGMTAYVGVMPLKYWTTVYINSGWPVRFMGEPLTLSDNSQILAGELLVNEGILRSVRQTTGIAGAILQTPIEKIYKNKSLRAAAFNMAARSRPDQEATSLQPNSTSAPQIDHNAGP